MARQPVPLRLDPVLIAEIDALAKATETPRTYVIEEAIKSHLHKLRGYVEMDKGPPKTAKAKAKTANVPDDFAWKAGPDVPPARIIAADGRVFRPVKPVQSIRGYAADGTAILR